jgi:cellulose biosynthesis protein BcsQ
MCTRSRAAQPIVFPSTTVLNHRRRLPNNARLPQMFRRLRLEGPIPRLKAFNNAAATGVPVSDVKGSPAIRTRKAYYAAGKELLTYAGET